MQNLSREHGQKYKGTRELHVFLGSISRYFFILAYRVLNSVLGLHDSIKLSWRINFSFSKQKLSVIGSIVHILSYILKMCFPTL